MSNGKTDPFARSSVSDLERLLRSYGVGGHAHDDEESNIATSHWRPAVDIREEADRFQIIADIPGVDPSTIDVSMAQGTLSIKGERPPESEQDQHTFRRMERSRGTFHRRFSLPDTADADGISARSDHGVLVIDIPKRDQAAPRRIQVGG